MFYCVVFFLNIMPLHCWFYFSVSLTFFPNQNCKQLYVGLNLCVNTWLGVNVTLKCLTIHNKTILTAWPARWA